MSWINATEWLGDDKALLWASDGCEIFKARYCESDLCEVPEQRLFIKETAKAWLPVLYIWMGKEEPNFLPANILSMIKSFSFTELLRYRFPELDRNTINLLYAKVLEKLPKVSLGRVMEEAL